MELQKREEFSEGMEGEDTETKAIRGPGNKKI